MTYYEQKYNTLTVEQKLRMFRIADYFVGYVQRMPMGEEVDFSENQDRELIELALWHLSHFKHLCIEVGTKYKFRKIIHPTAAELQNMTKKQTKR